MSEPARHSPQPPPALLAIGRRIHEQRKALRLGTTTTAEAAGISRVTLYRIECGEASVSIGAYLDVCAALGMQLGIVAPQGTRGEAAEAAPEAFPESIRISDYPQLGLLSWPLAAVDELAPKDALSIYERNWRHVDQLSLNEQEQALIRNLVERYGNGALLV
jgi:transcriptional regulator with XRE-family HTH domain